MMEFQLMVSIASKVARRLVEPSQTQQNATKVGSLEYRIEQGEHIVVHRPESGLGLGKKPDRCGGYENVWRPTDRATALLDDVAHLCSRHRD
jgi:hypothetical protein